MILPAGIRDGELICSGTSEASASEHLSSNEEQQQVLTSSKKDKASPSIYISGKYSEGFLEILKMNLNMRLEDGFGCQGSPLTLSRHCSGSGT